MTQTISCDLCEARELCKLDKRKETCFTIRDKTYKNEPFVNEFKWKHLEFFKELQEGKRTVYCGFIFDAESTRKHSYHRDWVLENFGHYIENEN
jgi:hypothetical protein